MVICCSAFALIIRALPRVWRALAADSASSETNLKSTAPRLALCTPAAAPPPIRTRAKVCRSCCPLLLRLGAASVVFYVVGVTVLILFGAAASDADAWTWLIRSTLFAAAAAAATQMRVGGAAAGSASVRELIACSLVAWGVTWFELGAVDMHLFGLFEVAGGSAFWDAVFHGSGVLAAAAGWVLLKPGVATGAPPQWAAVQPGG